MALLLINALNDEDNMDNVSFRWSTKSAAYQNLDLANRKVIMQAFRHIYETVPDWDPFSLEFAPDRLPVHKFIPTSFELPNKTTIG